jgi:2-C-methyl-D-erythritol 4-phosphate cytidylyltransferase
MNKAVAVIVAGGEGSRMATEIRKQYLLLSGLPILSRTLRAIAASPEIDAIFLAVPETDFDYCRSHVIDRIETDKAIHLVAGGGCRQVSVANALNAVPANEGIVLIHDGVRPFVSADHIAECIRTAALRGACSLGLPASDTVKEVDATGDVAGTLDRGRLWLTQTPQAFDLAAIRQGHARAVAKGCVGTDDASLIEQTGGRVRMIHGSPWNIKITTPEDLRLAELILECDLFRD